MGTPALAVTNNPPYSASVADETNTFNNDDVFSIAPLLMCVLVGLIPRKNDLLLCFLIHILTNMMHHCVLLKPCRLHSIS